MEPSAVDWLQYGVLGIVVLALIVGWIAPGRQLDRAHAKIDRLEEENKRIRDNVEERIIPLLTRAIVALESEAMYHHRHNEGDGDVGA